MDDNNCKSSFAPPSVIRNGTMEQLERWGEDNFNDGHDRFWALKKIRTIFCPSKVPAIFRESDFYLNSLIFSNIIVNKNDSFMYLLKCSHHPFFGCGYGARRMNFDDLTLLQFSDRVGRSDIQVSKRWVRSEEIILTVKLSVVNFRVP
jgi:hypothetical protein